MTIVSIYFYTVIILGRTYSQELDSQGEEFTAESQLPEPSLLWMLHHILVSPVSGYPSAGIIIPFPLPLLYDSCFDLH